MATSSAPADLPPGLHDIVPVPGLRPALARSLQSRGCSVLELPEVVTDFLVAATLRREFAFDLENLGLSGEVLEQRLALTLDGGPFAGRKEQLTETLSGGEGQLLALTLALAQPADFLLSSYAADYLSPARRRDLEAAIIQAGKRVLNLSASSSGQLWRWQGGVLESADEATGASGTTGVGSAFPAWTLHISGFRKAYEISAFALSIDEGHYAGLQVLGLAGENGSGKSTLADCLAGMATYTGELSLDLPSVDEPGIGYLTQKQSHPTHGMSQDDLLDLFVQQGKLTSGQLRRLREFLDNDPGYQQLRATDAAQGNRLLIALALLAGTYDLVILDEPTYGFAATEVAHLLQRFIALAGPHPLILISHDSNFLDKLCNSILRLENGLIIQTGT